MTDISYSCHINYRRIYVICQDILIEFTPSNFLCINDMHKKLNYYQNTRTHNCHRNNENEMKVFKLRMGIVSYIRVYLSNLII